VGEIIQPGKLASGSNVRRPRWADARAVWIVGRFLSATNNRRRQRFRVSRPCNNAKGRRIRFAAVAKAVLNCNMGIFFYPHPPDRMTMPASGSSRSDWASPNFHYHPLRCPCDGLASFARSSATSRRKVAPPYASSPPPPGGSRSPDSHREPLTIELNLKGSLDPEGTGVAGVTGHGPRLHLRIETNTTGRKGRTRSKPMPTTCGSSSSNLPKDTIRPSDDGPWTVVGSRRGSARTAVDLALASPQLVTSQFCYDDA